MNNRNANIEDTPPAAHLGRHGAPASPLRRVVGYGVGGAVGGGVLALIQFLGPDLLTEPALVRWVFLYTLLGGVSASVWVAATQWATTRFSLSRWGAVAASGLIAGTLLGAAALLLTALIQGARDGALLLRLPWADGLGGFLAGAVGGGLWQHLSP